MNFKNTIPSAPSSDNWGFIEDLKEPSGFHICWSSKFHAGKDDLDLRKGVDPRFEFPDPEGVLKTANDDLVAFLKAGSIYRSGGIPVITCKCDSGVLPVPESFKIEVTKKEIRIFSGDTEGLRRGIYHLEEMLLSSASSFLPIGITERKSWLRNRISRCFFGPIKRPPFNRDELMDGIDYYPEEYLNRLAHEGVNGLWLTVSFRDLCKTAITSLAPDAEKRLAKLRDTVAKCLRYGIKTWVFCIEPAGILPNDPLLKKYPELQGPWGWDRYCFCPSSEVAKQYLYDSTNWLFKQVPGLGGILNISHGERVTTCLSRLGATDNGIVPCPRCGSIPHWEILHRSLSAMKKGMSEASPSAELISWLYMPQPAPLAEWVYELSHHTPEGVILQFNFESGGYKNQLGHPRCGGDYWLSYVGPSDHFGRIANGISNGHTKLSAKIQVGCSHEVATVPFVSVPGLLYRKYEKMKKLGVSDVMQCWYFGNYPGIMNRAAGMLTGEDFTDSEEGFLLRLAGSEWGSSTETVVRAWQHFAEGYSYYPLSNQFQYYGPMHAGPAWPLYLKPVLKPLAPTWKPDFPPSGDAIGECLDNHTLEEAIILCGRLSEEWNEGVVLMDSLRPTFTGNRERLLDIGLAEALGIQFESGYNILKFYHLRKCLYSGTNSLAVLNEMQKIVESEILRSKRLTKLCEEDSRLGFHSEAESHLYHPTLLAWRIGRLRNLLDTEFAEVRIKMENGCAFSIFDPERQVYSVGNNWHENRTFRWRSFLRKGNLVFEFDCPDEKSADYDLLSLILTDCHAVVYPWQITFNNNNYYDDNRQASTIHLKKYDGGWQAEITLFQNPGNCYLQVIRRIGNNGGEEDIDSWPTPNVKHRHRLNLQLSNPENCGNLMLSLVESSPKHKKEEKTS
jgi:hypothetical protein